MNKSVKEHGDRLSEAERTILLLKSMGGSGDDNGGDKSGFIDALEILVENLRKECYSRFAEKDDLKAFGTRISDLEKEMKELAVEHANTSNSLN